jgi:hypothetical protein
MFLAGLGRNIPKWHSCEFCGRRITPRGQLLGPSDGTTKRHYLDWPQPSCLNNFQCKWRIVRLGLRLPVAVEQEAVPDRAKEKTEPTVKGAYDPVLTPNAETGAPSRSWMDTADTLWKLSPWVAGAFLVLAFLPSLISSCHKGTDICYTGRSNFPCY